MSSSEGGSIMIARPLIGVVMQCLEAVPGKLPACWIMGQRYVRTLTDAGAVPLLVPPLRGDADTLRALYERLDGLFCTGGVDIDPAHYGEERHACCDRGDSDRDWTELTLIRWALADGKPFFGVCRGIQALNVALGGSLYQHVPEQLPHALKHDYFPSADPAGPYTREYLAHPVRVEAGSRLARMLGETDLPVNSMHHQGIKRLAPGLTATARAPDGLIEGVERPNGSFCVGVQWHPEELAASQPPMRRLFTEFVAAALKGGRRKEEG
jgi:putative glutamine amidotransferase